MQDLDILKLSQQDAKLNFERGITESIAWLVRQPETLTPSQCATNLSRLLEAMRTSTAGEQ